jgi:hypothetical protein
MAVDSVENAGVDIEPLPLPDSIADAAPNVLGTALDADRRG